MHILYLIMYISGCNAKADIVFIIDSSGSVGRANYAKIMRFVMAIVDDLTISPNATQVGLVTFSSRAWMIFPLNR